MKGHQKVFLLFLIATVGLLGSCDNPALYGNVFNQMELGKPTSADLDEDASSDIPAVAQPALALRVETTLEEEGAAPLVDGLVDLFFEGEDALETMGDDGASMDTILSALVPEGMLEEEGALAAAIDAIIASLDDLDALADSVSENGLIDEGTDVQTLAMTAVFATVFNELVPTDPGDSVGEAIEAFYLASQTAQESGDPAPDLSLYVTFPSTDPDYLGELLTEEGSTTQVLLELVGLDIGALMSDE